MKDFELRLQNQLDRLVEGELSPDERRQLISQLDEDPARWRQCALAFLEAQSWRKAARLLVSDSQTAEPASIKPRPYHTFSRASTWAILAAAVLVAFGIGVGLGKLVTPANKMMVDQADADASSSDQAPRQPDGNNDTEQEDLPIKLLGYVNLGGDLDNVPVPIISGPGLDEEWLMTRPAPLSPYEVRQLETKGWKVAQHRQLVNVQHVDGSTLTIPVDWLEYSFVPLPVY